MSKLTLSVEKSVVTRARRYAKVRGISVSQMVETYLAAVATPPGQGHGQARDTPVLESLRGCLKKASIKDYRGEYRKHLAAKYR